MLTALEHDGPVIYLEHKLLADYWLESMGGAHRPSVKFDVPAAGAAGPVPKEWHPLPLGESTLRRAGSDVAIITVGVSVHRALAAAEALATDGIQCAVLDLRTVSPLDREAVCETVATCGRLLVVDEDYEAFGLSGEIAAVALEAGLRFSFARVCTQTTIPYARVLEDEALPNVERIFEAARRLMEGPAGSE
jgi:pyruvate dehydrogenase E1 component beta subunit